MTRTRLTVAAAAAAVVVAAALLGGVLREGSPAGPSLALAGAQTAADFRAGFARGNTASLVTDLQTSLAATPRDGHSWTLLGLAYQQRARETGDPSYYSKSDSALHRARALGADQALATSALGSLALSRHRFREALALGEQARRLSPDTARTYGVIGDALVELGRYREAFRAFDRMNALRPSLGSYARTSYARELLGHTDGAIRAMRLAVDAAGGEPEPTAWSHVQLGKLSFGHGRYRQAAHEYRIALAAFPGYPYALDAMAQAQAALGNLPRAIALERRAVDAIPLPQYVGLLGDLYRAAGKPVLARQQYALIGTIERLLTANGVRTDLEIALFQADHGIRPAGTLRRARLAYAARPSIDGEDVLAWALYRDGRCAEALPHAVRALRLGTQDALKLFHRGMIERCVGHAAEGRRFLRQAVTLSPAFSPLWSPVARRLAR